MLPEDQKRMEREADIAKALRGPDFSQLEASIARTTAVANEASQAQAQANREFDMHAAKTKAMRESVWVSRISSERTSFVRKIKCPSMNC